MATDTPLVFFYQHAYLRDRQLDTIRTWPEGRVLNPELARRSGAQVSEGRSLAPRLALSWKQRVPLVNLKLRPPGLPREAAVYVWGAVLATGSFISDLDNPFALVGYNYRAMRLYRPLLRRILESSRCVAIHCMSHACREGMRELFGQTVWSKAKVVYPRMERQVERVPAREADGCRFLFVGTQFEIKGGAALLKAFSRVRDACPGATLTLVTHLPDEFEGQVKECEGISYLPARFARNEVFDLMRRSDVLVHPTYVESFGMVILEAMANGLAVISTDIYATGEMVIQGRNGLLIKPPISVWEGVLPSRYMYDWPNYKTHVRNVDTSQFEADLETAMLKMAEDCEFRQTSRRASLEVIDRQFSEVS